MKSLVLYGAFFLIISALNAQVWAVDPLEPIYLDKNNTQQFSKKLSLDYAKNGEVAVHILVKVPKNDAFELRFTLDGKTISGDLSQLLAVPVEQNTGLDSRTEQFINKKNPYVIRRAPFDIFEVIQPVKTTLFVQESTFSAFRLVIPQSEISFIKKHKLNVLLYSGGDEYKTSFSFSQHKISIPKLEESNFFYTNWYSLKKMETYHNVERWSKEWYTILDAYAKLMAKGRQNSITLPRELLYVKNGEIILEEAKMLKFINVFRKYGFTYFEAPHLMNRGANDDWGDPELKVALTKKRYYKENGKENVEKVMQLIRDFAVKNNLTNNWLQHISDEPTTVNAKCYTDVAKQVKRIFPEVLIMEATNARENLKDAVDIWCPLINDFQENESFFRSREALGEKVLVYTCLIPGGKWLNRTLDMERTRQVYFGWGAAFYNTSGYLHWGLNKYIADPFAQSVVKHPSPAAGANNYLPAGDTHVVYPGKNGPLSSMRFEAHRIGCEDYDLLQLLKKKNSKKYDVLVSSLFRSYTDYDPETKDYRKTKKKLLKELSK